MKKFIKLLFPMALVCVVFALFVACDQTSTNPPSTPSDETVYTKIVTNLDDTYTYELTTQDGLSGTLVLKNGDGDELLTEHASSIGEGKFVIGGEGVGYTMNMTISGETFNFDSYGYFPGIVMPYSQVAGTYTLLMPYDIPSPGTITFNSDGTGTINYEADMNFTYYTVEGNKAIIVANDMDGEYVEFTEQGLNHLGSVYSPVDYVYFTTNMYSGTNYYDAIKSNYHVTHLGVVGNNSSLFYNDNGSYRIDKGSEQYYGSEEYVDVTNIYFGKTEFSSSDKFTFTSQNRDGYGYEMEKSVVDDKHYVTVKYETMLNQWGETCFDYECDKIVNGTSYWYDYYFERSAYFYSDENNSYGAEGGTVDYGDGYKSLVVREEREWGGEDVVFVYNHVVDPDNAELQFIFIECNTYHYNGFYEPVIFKRDSVNGVQPQYEEKRILVKTSEGAENGWDSGYIYASNSNDKFCERIGYYGNAGGDSLIHYAGVMNDVMYGSMQGYLYVDRERGTYKEIESSGQDLDENVSNALLNNPEGTYYDIENPEEANNSGVAVFDYKDGDTDRAYLFIYNFYSHEPRISMHSYYCQRYNYVEQADGDEMHFEVSWESTITNIVIKLTTSAEKKIASIEYYT